MLAALSSRRYTAGLEPPGQVVEGAAAATSRSAVSRRFVAATETAPAELMARRLDDLDLVAFMVDGVPFGEYTCVVALGIGIDGTKHPLAVEEGSTENATLVTDLITGLRDRGPDVTKPILAVLHRCNAESLLVSGELDVSTPAARPRRGAAHLPRGSNVIISNASHVDDMWGLQPQATTRLIAGFLATGNITALFDPATPPLNPHSDCPPSPGSSAAHYSPRPARQHSLATMWWKHHRR